MIIVRLSGGLGNQLFQFAAGYALALRHDTSIYLDARSFARDRLRNFALSCFGLQPENAPEMVKKWPPSRRGPISFPWWKFRYGSDLQFFRERGVESQQRFGELGPSTYLHGYWQNEVYFAEHANQVRSALKIVMEPDSRNQQWLARIRNRNAISVHVRRSDYTTNAVNQSLYSVCAPSYYDEAARYLADNSSSTAYFVVFSDEPEWASKNLRFPGEVDFISHNSGESAYEDLRLMSACKHHIIANSTFSWWGAWLGENPNRVIVAPSSWYRDPIKDQENPIPENWIRIPNGT